MKRTVVSFFLCLFAAVVIAGCAGTWMSQPLETFKPAEAVPPASVCRPFHPDQFDSWKRTRHADRQRMAKIPVEELRECGACHESLAAHAADPTARPQSVAKMTKTDKNTLCGKCHYSQKLFGGRAINPHGKHSLFANVALEGQPKQIAKIRQTMTFWPQERLRPCSTWALTGSTKTPNGCPLLTGSASDPYASPRAEYAAIWHADALLDGEIRLTI